MIKNNQCHSKYLKNWFAVLILVLGCTALLNYLVDPYGLYGSTRMKGLNAQKPAAGTHTRISKPYQVMYFSPKTIIGGNSRPEMGLDPSSALWLEEQRPVFNLGLPGAGIYMQARMLQHAIAGNGAKWVFWGLDFADFLALQDKGGDPHLWPIPAQEFEERLLVSAQGIKSNSYDWKRREEMFQTMLSLNATIDSLFTLYAQRDPWSPSIRNDGFNPARDYLGIISLEGQWTLFEQKNREVAKMFSRPGLGLYQGKSGWSREYETVSRLIGYAKRQGVKPICFINPYHVDYLCLIEMTGLWPLFECWKRDLMVLADNMGVQLWDFSEVNIYTKEQPPVRGDKKQILHWFWEPAHYRREYGDLMLRLMLDGSESIKHDEQIGVLLSKDSIDEHLQKASRNLADYKKQHPERVQRFQALIGGIRQQSPM